MRDRHPNIPSYVHADAPARENAAAPASRPALARDRALPPHRPADAMTFRSILFPPGLEQRRDERSTEPACLADLNLDQVIAAIVAERDEDILRPLFYTASISAQLRSAGR